MPTAEHHVPEPYQGDGQPPGLQFGLQFTAVRAGSSKYTHAV